MTRGKPIGRLLVLEGIDGSGKSTLQRELLRRLRRRGWRVAAWREPVDPAMGRVAQALGATDPLGSAVEFTVDRWLARPRLEALLRRRDVVVSDRSFYSTLAYQGSALPPPTRKSVARLQVAATVPPDQVLLLELPVSAALCRVRERGALLAPLERERTLRRVRAAYRAFARREGWTVLDARSAPKDLADRAERAVVARLPRRGRGRG